MSLIRDDKTHDYYVNYPATDTDPAVDVVLEANITGCIDALRKVAIEIWGKREVAKAATRNAAMVADMVRQTPVIEESLDWHPAVKYLTAIPGYKKDAAASVGTRTHAYAETLNQGKTPDVDADILPLAENYLHGFMERYRPTFNPDYIEFAVASLEYEYAGTMDMMARIGDDIWLLDVKTSSKDIDPGPRGFPYTETALQLAAGRWADFMGKPGDPKRYPIPPATRYGVVAVTRTDCQLVEYAVNHEDFRTFLAARKVWEWSKFRKSSIKVGIAPEVKAA